MGLRVLLNEIWYLQEASHVLSEGEFTSLSAPLPSLPKEIKSPLDLKYYVDGFYNMGLASILLYDEIWMSKIVYMALELFARSDNPEMRQMSELMHSLATEGIIYVTDIDVPNEEISVIFITKA